MATSDVDKAFFYYCLALTEYWEYQLEDSKLFFGEALRLGLEGEKKDNAEKALTEIEVKNSQGSCKVGEIYFADKWINETPLTSTGLDNITNEICVNVEFDSRECLADELTFVWKRDDNVICRHPYESEYFENSEVLGSMYYQDDHGILPEGKYTVQIYYGSTLLGEASHDHIKNE